MTVPLTSEVTTYPSGGNPVSANCFRTNLCYSSDIGKRFTIYLSVYLPNKISIPVCNIPDL
ncbi:MAG: hypothetical protein Ta2E_00550 [Mycoplasmoidaceae bacterium]|nr:MAG: hypothetical protein Ta2E_00550 [Mycoplasmoidaceae bacterium]